MNTFLLISQLGTSFQGPGYMMGYHEACLRTWQSSLRTMAQKKSVPKIPSYSMLLLVKGPTCGGSFGISLAWCLSFFLLWPRRLIKYVNCLAAGPGTSSAHFWLDNDRSPMESPGQWTCPPGLTWASSLLTWGGSSGCLSILELSGGFSFFGKFSPNRRSTSVCQGQREKVKHTNPSFWTLCCV